MKKVITASALLLFTEAWLALGIARLILVFVPFKRIITRESSLPPETYINRKNAISPSCVRELGFAIARAAKRCPWRTMCFEQALAGRMMLKVRHIPYVLTLGVRKDEQTKELKAHAWLKTGGMIVTGGGQLEHFTIIGNFNG